MDTLVEVYKNLYGEFSIKVIGYGHQDYKIEHPVNLDEAHNRATEIANEIRDCDYKVELRILGQSEILDIPSYDENLISYWL